MTVRVVNAIATANTKFDFGFGLMFPLLAPVVPVPVLIPRGNRGRCVSYFTLRRDVIPHTDNCCSMATRRQGDARRAGELGTTALLRGRGPQARQRKPVTRCDLRVNECAA